MPSRALTSGRKFSTDHVGLFHKAPKRFEAFLVVQVERHGPLVPVEVLEIRTMTRDAGLFAGGILHSPVIGKTTNSRHLVSR
jgi:hypothetical protein